MLLSLALIFSLGFAFSVVAEKVKLPRLVGFILAGIVLGPYGMNLLDASLLSISAEIRQMALVVILIRAGLSLNLADLKKVGRPALLMCFVPALFELTGTLLFAPLLFPISLLDAAVMGTVLAAVSPAVIVPKMLHLMDEGYGTEKGIPQLIMAGASVDDVFVIVLFTAFTGLAQTGTFSYLSLLQIPLSIVLGVGLGYVSGLALAWIDGKIDIPDMMRVLLYISVAFLLVSGEERMTGLFSYSGLLAVMATGLAFQSKQRSQSISLSRSFNQIWKGAEILLFVLVGATVPVAYAFEAGVSAVLLLVGILLFRLVGVYVSLLGTSFTPKEKAFCLIAYLPKATVQAAIGGVPLALGLPHGELILTVAVVSILVTAPLGAGLIEWSYKSFLTKETNV